jgi:hypothetical protein
MWAALALTTVLTAPAQAGGDLALKNLRNTYGNHGPTRKDDKLLPGDVLFVTFDIENLKVKDDGTISYAMGMELTRKEKDGTLKRVLKREPQDMEESITLGGTSLPGFANVLLGVESPPGEYTLTITVKDLAGRPVKTATVEKKFEVLPVQFGFVQVKLTSPVGEPAPAIGVRGQILLVHCALVGFATENRTKQSNVTFEMVVLDDAGKPTVEKSFKGDITKAVTTVMQFQPIPLNLNRTGKYTVVLKATDNIAKKSAEQKLALTVLDN